VTAAEPGADRLLVVDGANVVGSRPDGWWRDRAGAAARLHAAVREADLPAERVVLVLEGRARPGVPEGSDGAVVTVHAAGSGDDEIVRQAADGVRDGARVVVVTADRGLADRVTAVGASVERPGWLLGLLRPGDPRDTGKRAD
jgi:predicted RNA-binding protein with PIN domain